MTQARESAESKSDTQFSVYCFSKTVERDAFNYNVHQVNLSGEVSMLENYLKFDNCFKRLSLLLVKNTRNYLKFWENLDQKVVNISTFT